ncbi:Large-conductance mechanosensitive channel-like protein [Candidatus Nitrosotenuis uzonensis]|uniref:Large-conductance mechanosensitive channel-like protein n=1 Tax=Candidatus Nitrosotenuis uzonensis TaxID=1407055 RepID=A0A812F1B0_9ARCH|nr:Large-conductance mechanosensitive channel-like protein [Candidatus Nitrosotenuis uzonensis]
MRCRFVSEKPVERRGLLQEFVRFLQTFGVIGLAIAFVIGAASSKLVSSLVSDLINPLIGLVLQDAGELKMLSFTVNKSTFAYGSFIANVIDFAIIAFVVFILYKQLSRLKLVEDKTKPS